MSRTLSISCNKCREHLWIGQGVGSLYSGEPDTMEALRQFLFKHETTPSKRHTLTFEDDNSNDKWYSDERWHEFEPTEEKV